MNVNKKVLKTGQLVAYFMACFFFLIYPLYYHNAFFDIVTCKYNLIKIFVLVIFAVEMLIAFTYLMNQLDEKEEIKKNSKKKKNVKEERPKKALKDYFIITDWFMLAIVVINLISALLSDYFKESIDGANGRSAGLITVLCYAGIYIIISRAFIIDNIFIYVVALGSSLAGLLGILNGICIDPLKFYEELSAAQRKIYISTLGHVDVYTSLFAITIPILLMHYLDSKKLLDRIITFFALIINITGVISGQCDMAFLVIAASIILVICFEQTDWNLVLFMAPFVISMYLTKILTNITLKTEVRRFTGEYRDVSEFTKLLIKDETVLIITIFFIACVIVNLFSKLTMKKYKKIFVGISIAVPVIYVLLVIYFTFVNKTVNLGKATDYLRFSDAYASYRGFIWKLSIEEYLDMDIMKKLFGIGPDVVYPYLTNIPKHAKAMGDVVVYTGGAFDNLHNEFLQYLFTTGICGLAAYIGFIVCSIKNGIKGKKYILIVSSLGYVILSIFNLNQVVTTPIYVIVLSALNAKENNIK